MEPAIRVENLGKLYRVTGRGERANYSTLRETVMHAAGAPLRWARQGFAKPDPAEDFWALKGVDFEVMPGEVVGIIGRNGAGKSTLLKILSRITKPTTGRVTLNGRVGSLLEVGTGFHPELTGRENVYLNGSILGMTRREIAKKFDEIVAFAEVERFLDTPVKRYSSGMYVRLAFAVAAHLEPEILIVDEVLAVGDAGFQKKCMGKMQEVGRQGRTVLFVSHNTPAIRALCSQGIVMNKGGILFRGDVEECLSYASGAGAVNRRRQTWRTDAPKSPLGFVEMKCEVRGKQPNHILDTRLNLRSGGDHKSVFVAVEVADASGGVILQSVPIPAPFVPGWSGTPATHSVEVQTHLPPLIPGEYSVSAWCGSHFTETVDMIDAALWFEIEEPPTRDRSFPYSGAHGSIAAVATATCNSTGSPWR